MFTPAIYGIEFVQVRTKEKRDNSLHPFYELRFSGDVRMNASVHADEMFRRIHFLSTRLNKRGTDSSILSKRTFPHIYTPFSLKKVITAFIQIVGTE